ncbi:MAG TPA: dehydrogenase [Prolixibacteraceae bacterium]|nr:dehydrogenase [Prolixibacteraceae bacterium]
MKSNSRRKFIQKVLVGSTGLAVLPLLQSYKVGANEVIRLGFIGLGQQAINLMRGFNKISGVQIVAGADVYGIKRERFEKLLKENYQSKNASVVVKTYKDYRQILDRADIDAVVIATPDHWHAMIALDACKAGKDIYQEKPITYTIEESLKVAAAVRKNKVIFAVGSQQRSDSNFQHAVNMVRKNALGELKNIYAFVGPPPTPYNLPKETIPSDLDWDQWLGPNPYVHYNSKLNPPISIDPPQNETFWARWRYYKETGGGFTCDWGAHNFDIGQWALNMDNSGPIKIIPAGYKDTKFLSYIYDNGVVMTNQPYDDIETRGIKFWGTTGWIEVSRGKYAASDDSLLPLKDEDVTKGLLYESGIAHLVNFIDSLRSRKDTIAPVEAGQRTCTVCILGNIAHELQRPVNWDPKKQFFVNDLEAEKFFKREYRKGYSL